MWCLTATRLSVLCCSCRVVQSCPSISSCQLVLVVCNAPLLLILKSLSSNSASTELQLLGISLHLVLHLLCCVWSVLLRSDVSMSNVSQTAIFTDHAVVQPSDELVQVVQCLMLQILQVTRMLTPRVLFENTSLSTDRALG